VAYTPDEFGLVFIRPASEPDTAPARVVAEIFESHFRPLGFIVVDNDNQPVEDAPAGRRAAVTVETIGSPA
jgi:hypothetical protein